MHINRRTFFSRGLGAVAGAGLAGGWGIRTQGSAVARPAAPETVVASTTLRAGPGREG